MKNKVLKLIRRFLALFPSKLPIGMTEFYRWADDVIDLSGLPHNDSTVFSLATMILHLKATEAYKSKQYFILTIKKGAANQIAAGVMQELKDKQLAKAAEENAAKAAAIEAGAK